MKNFHTSLLKLYFRNSRNQGKKPSASEYGYLCQNALKLTYAHLGHEQFFSGVPPLDSEKRREGGRREGEGRGGEGGRPAKCFVPRAYKRVNPALIRSSI
jgi:hypothetical protein